MATTMPDRTADVIARFDEAMARAKRAVGPDKTAALMRQVYRLGADLKAHADDLESKLEKGEAWLNANATVGPNGERNASDHPQWHQREAQWFAWEAEYRAVMDALERGKAVL